MLVKKYQIENTVFYAKSCHTALSLNDFSDTGNTAIIVTLIP